jgi:hypothetical protein
MVLWTVAAFSCLLGIQAAFVPQKKSFLLKVESQIEPWWEQTKHHASTRLQCGVTEQVGAHTDKYEDCPADCPYFAQNRKDTEHCTFLCVPGAQCGQWNPNKPIPDSIKNSKTCRGPKVAFCTVPKLDGSDTCNTCMSGYALHAADGQCYFAHWTAIIIVGLIFVVLFTVVIVWFVDMCIRTPVNQESVVAAQNWRSRSKILKSKEECNEEGRRRHPYDTFEVNMCKHNVAGPGMLLHFNFQAFFIIWPFCVACVWVALAIFHNELFILGTRKFGTPRHNCILVAWGYETQQRLMWTKVLFLVIVYIGSFVSFLLFSIRQHRIYQMIDMNEKTMKDFAIELKGLPELNGPTVERAIHKCVEEATKKTVVGVSVAWNYKSSEAALNQDDVDAECNRDLAIRAAELELEKELGRPPKKSDVERKLKDERTLMFEPDPCANYGSLRTSMYKKEKSILGPDEEEEKTEEEKDTAMAEALGKLVTSDVAFVVFNTEEEKDEALKEFSTDGIAFDATEFGFDKCVRLKVSEVDNEPANINWHNFGETNPNAMLRNFCYGFWTVYVPALLVWFFGFYVPYAWSLYSFNYDNGAELPGYYALIFTIVVCGGNATMYVVCDICCDIIGFRYKDTKQVCYMLMYLVACMINVFLDMVVTYFTAWKVMVGLDFRTYHGERLADIKPFTEQFETYAMQRSLGENTYRYAWPSTFFLCFVLEPFVTILIPYQLGKVLVRTHKEIRGTCAEAYMMAFEFDLGRYADILLNVFLGILIFYFPGGYIWTLFYFMCFSHCFIYCFDHWRVINVIPAVKIVSCTVDWWAQVTMCMCCAMILACLVFKANCEWYSGYCMFDMKLIAACTVAGVAHFIVHFLLLVYFVPTFSLDKIDQTGDGRTDFTSVAAGEPRTWFSVNPVHCLRSKYIHKQSPHCRLASWGKEHLLEVGDNKPKPENHNLCYYYDEPAEDEDFTASGAAAGLRKSFSSLRKSFRESGKLDDELKK